MARLERMTMFDEEFGPATFRTEKKSRDSEWECTVCGYVCDGRKPPAVCPECGADEDEFELWEYEDEDRNDEDWD